MLRVTLFKDPRTQRAAQARSHRNTSMIGSRLVDLEADIRLVIGHGEEVHSDGHDEGQAVLQPQGRTKI